MGNSLCLYKDGKYISDLGPAHNFQIDLEKNFSWEFLEKEFEGFKSRMLVDMIKNIAYSPKSKEEMEDIVRDFQENMEYFIDETLRFGRMFLVSYILEEDGLEAKDDYEIIRDKQDAEEYPDCDSIKGRKALEVWMKNDGFYNEAEMGFKEEAVDISTLVDKPVFCKNRDPNSKECKNCDGLIRRDWEKFGG